jgi:uncharacterized protein YjiS (DUF1127 family)
MGRVIVISGASEGFATLTAGQLPANDDSIAAAGLFDLIRYRSQGHCDYVEPFTPLQYADLFDTGAVMSIFPSKSASRPIDFAPKLVPLHSGRDYACDPHPFPLLPAYRRVKADVVVPVVTDNMSLVDAFEIAPSERYSRVGRSIGAIRRFVAFLRHEREVFVAVRQLAKMSDRDLYDIGIERGQIEQVVRHGRDID